jgi:hypothetical protein
VKVQLLEASDPDRNRKRGCRAAETHQTHSRKRDRRHRTPLGRRCRRQGVTKERHDRP